MFHTMSTPDLLRALDREILSNEPDQDYIFDLEREYERRDCDQEWVEPENQPIWDD